MKIVCLKWIKHFLHAPHGLCNSKEKPLSISLPIKLISYGYDGDTLIRNEQRTRSFICQILKFAALLRIHGIKLHEGLVESWPIKH